MSASPKMEKPVRLARKLPVSQPTKQKQQVEVVVKKPEPVKPKLTKNNKYGTTWYQGCSEVKPMATMMTDGFAKGDTMFVARDVFYKTPEPSRSKVYASYKNHTKFWNSTKNIKDEERTFYVIVPDETPCTLFADLEWNLQWRQEEEIVEKFIEIITEYLKEYCDITITEDHFKFATASLEQADKGSIHAHVPAVVFKSIQEQKIFFNTIQHDLLDDDDWTFIDETDKSYIKNTFIDFAVYNKNRQIRLPWSSKMNSAGIGVRPLIPYDIDGFDISEWVITDVSHKEHDVDITKCPSNTKTRRFRFNKTLVQNILDAHNLDVSVDSVKNNLVLLRNKTGNRCCAINGEENTSDNAYCTIKDNQLFYHCHDSGCNGQKKLIHTFDEPKTKQLQDNPPFETYYWRMINILKMEVPAKEKEDMVKSLQYEFVKELNQYCCVVIGSAEPYVLVRQSYQQIGNDKKSIFYRAYKFDNFQKAYSQFSSKLGMGRPGVGASIWINDARRRQVHSEVCIPNTPSTKDIINTFEGFAITKEEALEKGTCDAKPLLDFIKTAWCEDNDDLFNSVLNWMAHLIQKPEIKMKTCLVLKGLQGVGKGMIVQLLGKIIGSAHFIQPTSQDEIFGTFNYLMNNRFLVFMDEMFWGGEKKNSSTLKKLLTEETWTSNEKNVPQRKIQNRMNFIFASNENWVINAGSRARRFTVLSVNETLYKLPREEVVKLATFCPYSFAKVLYSRDLTGFDPHVCFQTSGLIEQKIFSMPQVHSWWMSKIEDFECEWFGNDVISTLPYNDFRNEHPGMSHMSAHKFWSEMKAFHDLPSKRQRLEGERMYVKTIPCREECRIRFNDVYDCKMIADLD